MSPMHPMYKKLAAMSGMAVAFLAGKEADAQILINTFTEDSVAKDGYYIDPKNDVGIDVNLDGFDDIDFHVYWYSACWGCNSYEHSEVVFDPNVIIGGSFVETQICTTSFSTAPNYWGGENMLVLQADSVPIPGDLDWEDNPLLITDWDPGIGDSSGCFIHGGPLSGYLPFQLEMVDGIHYGWARLSLLDCWWDLDASVCVRIDQTAFNISPGEGLLTGRLDQVGVIQIADSLNIEILGYSGLPEDVRLTAHPASHEDLIDRYRLFLVPEEDGILRNPGEFKDKPEEYSISILPGSDTISAFLSGETLDLNGVLIDMGKLYRFVILHEFADGIAYQLSEYSEPSRLSMLAAITSVNDGLDACEPPYLQASFVSATEESFVEAYRLFLSKAGSAPSLDELLALPAEYYVEILPDGSFEHQAAFSPGSLDTDGDELLPGSYSLILVTMSSVDTIPTGLHQMDGIIYGGQAATLSEFVATSNSQEIDPFNITYTVPVDDELDWIQEIRIYIQEYGDDVLTDDEVLDLESGNYIVANIASGEWSGFYPDSIPYTFNGDCIEYSKSYQFVSASVPAVDCISMQQTVYGPVEHTYEFPVATLSATDIGGTGNTNDINISIADWSGNGEVASYHVFLTRTSDAIIPDFSIAKTLTTEQLTSSPDHEFNLAANQLDYLGEKTYPGTSYDVHLLIDRELPFCSTLASTGETVIYNPDFPDLLNLYTSVTTDGEIAMKGSFIPLEDEQYMDAYRVYIVPVENEDDLEFIEFNVSAASLLSDDRYKEISPSGASLHDFFWPLEKLDTKGNEVDPVNGHYRMTIMPFSSEQETQYLTYFSPMYTYDPVVSASFIGQPELQFISTDNGVIVTMSEINKDELSVFDMNGRSINIVPIQTAPDQVLIPATQLPVGIYILYVKRNDLFWVKKIIVN